MNLNQATGTPDYRSSESSTFAQLHNMGFPKYLASEKAFSIDYFKKKIQHQKMKMFYSLVKKPIVSHYFQTVLLK